MEIKKIEKLSEQELTKRIKACKTKTELDDMRLPVVKFVPQGGSIDVFYKLQKIFKTQKNKIARMR